MKLERDICFLDIESTGLSFLNDEIIELAILKLKTDGTKETRYKRFKPTVPISEEATKVHNITMDMLENEKPFKNFSKGIFAFLEGCDLCAYNGNRFDIPFLYSQMEKHGIIINYTEISIIDPMVTFIRNEPRDLKAAYKFYCGKEISDDDAHNALYDTEVLSEVFEGQVKMYGLDTSINGMKDLQLFCNYDDKLLDLSGVFTTNEKNEVIFKNGKHKGKLIDGHTSYLQFILRTDSGYTNNAKMFAQNFLNILNENKNNG